MVDFTNPRWTHGVGLYGLYGLWQYHSLTGSQKALETAKAWFDQQLAIGTTKNINTMSPFLTLAYLYEKTGESSYVSVCWRAEAMPRGR